MKYMGWTWREYLETPLVVVEAVIDDMRRESSARERR